MSWGTGPWGATPWGGLIGGPAGTAVVAFVNSRPFPVTVSVVGVAAGGVNNIVLTADALSEVDTYKDFWLVYHGPTAIVSRRIENYLPGRVCELYYDMPFAIPGGANVWLVADDSWIPDKLHIGVRPSLGKRIDISTVDYINGYGNSAMDGVRNFTTLGTPEGEHIGFVPEVSDLDSVRLDVLASVPAWMFTTEDSFKGLVLKSLRGVGKDQERRVVRYDSSNNLAYLDKELATRLDHTTEYQLINSPSLIMGAVTSPFTSGLVGIKSQYSGMLLEKAAAGNPLGVMCMGSLDNPAYDFSYPLQLQVRVYIFNGALVGGRAGICFGFVMDGNPTLGIMGEVMEVGGNLVLRISGASGAVHDFLLDTVFTAPITNRYYDFRLLYIPEEDELHIDAVDLSVTWPGQIIQDDAKITNVKGSGGFVGRPVYSNQRTPFCFFGIGIAGAASKVQFTRVAFMHVSEFGVKAGKVQGILDGEVISALPNRSEAEELPLDWRQPWLPIAGGSKDPRESTEIKLAEPGFTIDRTSKEATPYMLARQESQLGIPSSSGFLLTVRVRALASDITPIDHIGAAFGGIVNIGGTLRDVQASLLEDFGDRLIGIRLAGGDGELVNEHLAYKSDWRQTKQYRLVFDPAPGDGSIIIFEDGEKTPLAIIPESLFTSLPVSELDYPAMFYGLRPVATKVTLTNELLRYNHNAVCYFPQLYANSPKLPEAHTAYPWFKHGLGTSEYVQEESQPVNGYVKLVADQNHVFYYRDLDSATVPEHVFRPTDGFVVDFRAAVDEYVNRHTGRSAGTWSGVGMTVDDGGDRHLIGFADGGERGKFIFIPGADPDTGKAMAWEDVHKWVESAVREPARWQDYVHYIDWTQETLYRFERSSAITSDRNARLRLFVNDELEPVIDVAFARGETVIGTDDLGSALPLSGGTPRIAWGSFIDNCQVTSRWREIIYSISVGFDLTLHQRLTFEERDPATVDSARPALGSMVVLAEEA